jgi:hypothetical protein
MISAHFIFATNASRYSEENFLLNYKIDWLASIGRLLIMNGTDGRYKPET